MEPFDHADLGSGAHLVVVAVQLVVAVNCVAGVPFAQCDNCAALVGGERQCGRVKAPEHPPHRRPCSGAFPFSESPLWDADVTCSRRRYTR